jgi:hypothetical protein
MAIFAGPRISAGSQHTSSAFEEVAEHFKASHEVADC